jgi:hypothetical protein
MNRATPHALREVPEVRFGLAQAAVLVAATLCERLGADVATGTVVLTGVAAAGSVRLPLRLAALVGLSAWAFVTGFVVNAGGQLTFGAADLDRLVLVELVALVAAVVARPSAHVDVRSPGTVRLGPAEHLAGDRRHLADADEQEAQQLGDRVALGPLEVEVRGHAGAVAHVEDQ